MELGISYNCLYSFIHIFRYRASLQQSPVCPSGQWTIGTQDLKMTTPHWPFWSERTVMWRRRLGPGTPPGTRWASPRGRAWAWTDGRRWLLLSVSCIHMTITIWSQNSAHCHHNIGVGLWLKQINNHHINMFTSLHSVERSWYQTLDIDNHIFGKNWHWWSYI